MTDKIKICHETFNVAKLEKRDEFIDQLYDLHSRIFSGVSRAKFISYVIDPPAEQTKIRVFKNGNGEMIGYCAVHLYRISVDAKSHLVIRAESGLVPEYRGHNMTLIFGYEQAFQYRLLHPFSSLYYLGNFVHPGVFHMFGRFFKTLYPHFQHKLPESTRGLMLEMANIFGVPAVNPEEPMVRDVGWITIEDEAGSLKWQQDEDPWVKYYIKNNPDYAKGYGLVVLVPLTLSNMIRSLGRYLARRSLHHRPGQGHSHR